MNGEISRVTPLTRIIKDQQTDIGEIESNALPNRVAR